MFRKVEVSSRVRTGVFSGFYDNIPRFPSAIRPKRFHSKTEHTDNAPDQAVCTGGSLCHYSVYARILEHIVENRKIGTFRAVRG